MWLFSICCRYNNSGGGGEEEDVDGSAYCDDAYGEAGYATKCQLLPHTAPRHPFPMGHVRDEG